jgi:diguanylate cyclase (GGDEF)-like protein
LFFGLALIGFLLAAIWAGIFVSSRTVNELLAQDAKAEGEAWTRYLAANVRDLEAIIAGSEPSAESMTFFEQAQQVGDVFLYKIYDAQGGLRLSSDHLEETGREAGSIPVHNPEAAEVVLEGDTVVEVESAEEEAEEHAEEAGEHPEEAAEESHHTPAYYSEAYVPVVLGGEIIGIVETYIDQTSKRDIFQARLVGTALALGGIIAIACGVPAVGFYWRTRQKRDSDTRAEFLADHDPLTGLLNRARFMSDLDVALSLGCRVAVHCIDVDRFKEINETLGHAAGDEILKQVAARLTTLTRQQDLVARLGADEFAIAQVVGDERQTDAFARRLSAALSEPFHLKDQDVESSASMGTAFAPEHGADAEALMKSAEIALSNSKSEGSGCRSQFRPEMDAELQARRDLENLLRRAVANNGFELHFQPIYRIASGSMTGFEALLRLPTKNGFIPPATFIPIAERMGLITAIGEWVVRRACEIAASWPDHLAVAVNLSPVQFEDGNITRTVESALNASGLSPARLELEITEGLLLSDTDWIMGQLGELKKLGVRIAMDDFGTGYSSLNYLWKFPFDKLKIDQSFVRGLRDADAQLTSVIRTIVALGRSLEMTITAEGVETEDQVEFLREVGCDELQGFFLGRPMPIENLPAAILRDVRSASEPTRATVAAAPAKVAVAV